MTFISRSSTSSTSLTDLFRVSDISNDVPLVLAPSVSTGDVLSGNDVAAPIASGNDTSVSDIGNAVVNDIGGDTSLEGGDITGGDIGTSVDDLVDGGDIGANVDNLVGDILADLGIED